MLDFDRCRLLTLFLLASVCGVPMSASAGSRTSTGGDIVLRKEGTNGSYLSYSLDLVEYGLEHLFYRFALPTDEAPLDGYQKFEKVCPPSNSWSGGSSYNIKPGCLVIYMDTPDRAISNMLRSKRLISGLLLDGTGP